MPCPCRVVLQHGFAMEIDDLVGAVGMEKAKWFHGLSMQAQRSLRRRIDDHQIDCDVDHTGSLEISMFSGTEDEYREVGLIALARANPALLRFLHSLSLARALSRSLLISSSLFCSSVFSVSL